MKRNTFMKRLAVTALTATMTVSMAVPTFAASKVTDASDKNTSSTSAEAIKAAIDKVDLNEVTTDEQAEAKKADIEWAAKKATGLFGDRTIESASTSYDSEKNVYTTTVVTKASAESGGDVIYTIETPAERVTYTEDKAKADADAKASSIVLATDAAHDNVTEVKGNAGSYTDAEAANIKSIIGADNIRKAVRANTASAAATIKAALKDHAIDATVTATYNKAAKGANATITGQISVYKNSGSEANATYDYTLNITTADEKTVFQDAVSSLDWFFNDPNNYSDFDANGSTILNGVKNLDKTNAHYAALNGVTITSTTNEFTDVTDGANGTKTGKGVLHLKKGNAELDYEYTIQIGVKPSTREEALQAAINSLTAEDKVFPDYDEPAGGDGYYDWVYAALTRTLNGSNPTGYKVNDNSALDNEKTVLLGRIASKINKYLNNDTSLTNNFDVTADEVGVIEHVPATHDKDGSATVVIYAVDKDGNIQKDSKGNKTGYHFDITLKHSDDQKLAEAETAYKKAVKTEYDADSELAQSVQKTGATAPATAGAIANAVQALLPSASDDVTYTATVSQYTGSTFTTEGEAKVTVSATTANDWYTSDMKTEGTTNAKTKSRSMTVTVKLPRLKKNVARQISIDDKTYRFKDAQGEVNITPSYTPAEANYTSELVYTSSNPDVLKFVGSDGKLYDSVKVGSRDGSGNTPFFGTVKAKFLKKGASVIRVQNTTDPGMYDTATYTVQKGFDDVQNTAAYYYDAVYAAANNGVTAGVTETSFGRTNTVTRAQFVTWLYQIAVKGYQYDKVTNVTSQFSDVPATKWYAEAVTWAVKNGVTSGTTSTTFSPNREISRAEAMTMIWRLAGSPVDANVNNSQFTDVPSNKYYAQAVAWATKNGITEGTSATTFGPKDPANRGNAMVFLSKAFPKGWFEGDAVSDAYADNVVVDAN